MHKQIQGEHKKHIEEQIAAINADISSSKHWIMKENAANRLGANFMRRREEKAQQKPNSQRGIKKIITVEDSCVGCGVCVNVCPVDSISLDGETGKINLENKYFMCFACVQNCPTNAIHLKHEMGRSRYRNGNVTLQEIAESNEWWKIPHTKKTPYFHKMPQSNFQSHALF